MGKPPAFQLYASDFYMDTISWTAEQVGIYTRLLFYQWVNGSIPDDLEQIARIAGCMGDRKWRTNMERNWRELCHKFATLPDGRLVNLRMEKTRKEQEEFRKLLVESGRLGAEKRWKTHKKPISPPISPPNGEMMPLQSSSSSSSSKKKVIKNIYAESVRMTEEEYNKLKSANGEYVTNKAIQILSNYKLSSGKHYKSDYHAILTWALDKAKGAGNGTGQPPGRFGVRTPPQEDPSVIADVEAINAKFRLKQLSKELAERSAPDKAEKDD